MTRIQVDSEVLSKLNNLDSTLELCNESGVTLGHFYPAADRKRKLYEWAKTAFSDEELEAAEREPGGVTTEELLARLKAR
jgi:hypothetical protein